jgi:transcriptional regulator with XRE-family HTH domain
VNEVQTLIAQLQDNGWTLAALADELGVTVNAVEKWKAGDRYPQLEKPVIDALNRLLKRNRIPKKKRYAKGSRRNPISSGG